MEKSFLTWTAAALGTAILLTACNTNTGTTAPGSKVKLDPSKPVSLTVWHYYNGAQQAAFDQLISEFNATEGKEKGIYVEGYTQGSVGDLEKAVSDAVAAVEVADSEAEDDSEFEPLLLSVCDWLSDVEFTLLSDTDSEIACDNSADTDCDTETEASVLA